MSYLSYPRLHFSGGFIADPSTLNNTPNNYDDDNDQISELELYWNPNGTGKFDLQHCVVTKVVYGPGDETTDPEDDPIIGQQVIAAYTKAPPKIVDLDPDQQNVSEIWGLRLKAGGLSANPKSIENAVSGDYMAGPFNAIWVQSLKGPRSSASGSGVYQSQLRNLTWSTDKAPQSRFLNCLKAAAGEQLSVNFVVNSHNNSPVIYAFNPKTFKKLAASVPLDIIGKLKPMGCYIENFGRGKIGDVPTESYVIHELSRLLGQQDADQYRDVILKGTRQQYDQSKIDTDFPTGLITGTLGPQADLSPAFYTPSRILAPHVSVVRDCMKISCYFAPFNASSENSKTRVTLNLGNALATNKPGVDVATDQLGELSLVYFNQAQEKVISLATAVTFAKLPADLGELMKTGAGIIEVTVDNSLLPTTIAPEQANRDILTMPLGLVGQSHGQSVIWLAENIAGYNLRADQFVFRMNPGVETTDQQPRGETALMSIYVTAFGQPAANICLDAYVLSENQALQYTNSTLGTSGTLGLKNLSTPQAALRLSDLADAGADGSGDATTIRTDENGVARLKLSASDPGVPRADQDLDGQIYFIRYTFSDRKLADSYQQDANDLISVHLYSQMDIPEKPTWDNCIKVILPQYGKLYPIMGRFQLADYDAVVANAKAIKMVLSKPIEDPLHMPVIRDLSIARIQAILQWIDKGAPEN